jgi:ABC-type lipoprotein export system ATPase subunit
VVSHDAAAADIADRLVHVRDGRVVEEGRPGDEPDLVVSRGGWIHLPLRDLDGGRVSVQAREEVLVRQLRADGGAGMAPAGTSSAAPENGDALAELRKVEKSYGSRRVLAGLDLRVERGRFIAVVGRSGSGKTTLLHLIAGLERPSAGEIVVTSQPLDGLSRSALAALRREAIAIVTQEPGLVPHLSASENVVLGLDLRGTAAAAARAEAALASVGLAELRERRAATLSAGERQRVAIARAFACGAELLLADEPTARLDEENALGVGRLLADAAHERGLAVVCATHDSQLLDLADDVVRLE